MDNVALFSQEERGQIFAEAAAQMGTTAAIVEKDFWVCWVLQKIYDTESLKNILLFKGGTSLSKVYNVIQRFSEDIDLILDWNLVSSENPNKDRSNNKQDKFNKQINKNAQEFIAFMLLPKLEGLYFPVCQLEIDINDPHCVNVKYPNAFDNAYIRPEVRLEIGPLSSWQPSQEFTITPYVAQYLPQIFNLKKIRVRAIKGKRTFWEKATILHQEAHRPEDKLQPARYSRHYYDLAMLAHTEIKTSALSDLHLLKEVIDFKKKFYPVRWAHYETAIPGSFKLIPPERIKQLLIRDYREMQDMIFGKKISLSEIFETLRELEEQINNQSPNSLS
ncbi:nucleotidyl transferase AbiEii/AbiGii toxin family protein [Sphaerochaeta halotolerans]|uniref:Nucleotidyl transferase AbiEii/AbiGii toxin family protein n=1 Tax=Sphaerochaeta halotolerans TaxID=2293840 RepID=A0A372MJB6_9SPIR|nr:nucleotidyl transferase AbiEii/AbiGii toxin family protein [Sphaerochaeta halotolerans]RFU95871.1 nucleotidyl transferase AbiEii/AbiGii toxin family protein [Sphaerochaeta halotolerans]